MKKHKNISPTGFRVSLLFKSFALGLLFVIFCISANAQSIDVTGGDSTLSIKDTLIIDYIQVGSASNDTLDGYGGGIVDASNTSWDYNPAKADGIGYDSLIVYKNNINNTDTLVITVLPRIEFDTTFTACENDPAFPINFALDTPSTGDVIYSTNVGAIVSDTAFDPSLTGVSGGNTYDIYAIKTVTVGGTDFTNKDTTTVTVESPPTAYDLMKDTSYCQDSSGVELWMAQNENGVNYVLEQGDMPVDTVTGDGNDSLTFSGTYKAETYTAYAYTGGCQTNMNNSVTVSEISTVSSDIIYYTSDTSFCPGGTGVEIGLDTSMLGVDYKLYREGNLIKTISGDGNNISFGPQTDSTGYYKVKATNGSCERFLDDSIKVYKKKSPVAYDLEGDTTVCIGGTGTFYLTNSDSDVTYELFDKNSPGSPYTTKSGTDDSVFFSVSDTGTYYAIGEHTTTCRTTMNNEVTLDYHSEFNVNVSKGDTTICKGDSTEIAVSNGVSWEWSPSGSLDDNTVSNPIASPLSTETYNVTVTNSNGCKDDTSITVTVNSLPGANAGLDRSICNGDTTLLSANYNSSYSYSWSPISTLASDDSVKTMAYPTTNTTYEVTVTDENGCVNKDEVQVTIDSVPAPTVNDSTICPGGSATLTATDGDTFEWLPGGDTGPSITKSPDDTTTYEVTAKYNTNGCSAKATGTIFVKEAPTVSLNTDNSFYICSGCDTTIEASATDGSSPYDYLWSNGADTSTVTLSTTVDTSYQVTVTDSKTCQDTTTVTMYVNPTILVDSNYCASQDSFQLTVDKGSTIPDGKFIVFDDSDTLYSAMEGTPEAFFYPSSQGAGDYGVKYLVSDGTTSYEDSVGFTVHPLPDASFTLDGIPNDSLNIQFCNNYGVVDLQGIHNSGGSYYGSGVSSDKLETESTLPGDIVISRTYTSAEGCMDSVTADVHIKDVPEVTINGLASDYCATHGEFEISASPDSGSYSAPWTDPVFVDSGDGTAHFNPSLVPDKDLNSPLNINYEIADTNGCSADTTQQVTVHEIPNVWIENPSGKDSLCENGAPITLIGHPDSYTGKFIKPDFIIDHDNDTATFDPSLASEGTYEVVYEYNDSLSGCSGTDTLKISIMEPPEPYNLTGGGSYCKGTSGVQLKLTDSDSSVNYQLYKNGSFAADTLRQNDGGFTFNGYWKNGDYFVKAVSSEGCLDTSNYFTVSVKHDPEDAWAVQGDTVVAVGGTGSYTHPALDYTDQYNWSVPSGAIITSSPVDSQSIDVSFSGVSPGYDTISVYGTNSNSCGVGDSDSLIIEILALPDTARGLPEDTLLCEEDQDVVFSVDPIGNADSIGWTVPDNSYNITNGKGTNNIELDLDQGAPSGWVTARGYNASGEGYADSVYVTVNNIPNITINGLDSTYCSNDPSTTIIATPDSGKYSAPWSAPAFADSGDGTAHFDPSQLSGGSTHSIGYSVTKNGCTADTSMNITIHEAPDLSFSGLPDTVCQGAPPYLLEGNYKNDSASFSGPGITDNNDGTAYFEPTTAIGTGNKTISYAYTDSITGCSNKILQEVYIRPAPQTYSLSADGHYCEDTPGDTITLNGGEKDVYYKVLQNGSMYYDTTLTASVSSVTFDTSFTEGSYEVTARTPKGCTMPMSNEIQVTMWELPDDTSTITGDDTVTVNGIGYYDATPIPNTGDYHWVKPSGATIDSGNGTRHVKIDFASTAAGNRQVGIYGSNSCGNGDTTYYNVYVLPKPAAVDTITGYTKVCAGTEGLTYDVVPGADSIVWDVPDNFTIVSGRGTQTIEVNIDSSSANNGYISAYGVNASGSGKADSIYVTVNPIPSIDNVLFYPDELDCAVDSVLIVGSTSTPDSSFKWTFGGGTVNNDSVYATSPEDYTLTVSAHGCTTDTTVTVQENTTPPTLSIDTPDTITCNNPTEELKVNTSTDSIVWTASSGGNIVSGANTAIPVVNTDGDYTVTVTSTDNFCSATDNVSVHKDTSKVTFDIYDPADISCDKDTSVITADNLSDVSYEWNKNGTGDDIIDGRYTHSVTVKDTGTYTLKVTKDSNGCTSVDSAFVGLDDDKPTNINLDKSGDITCDEDQVTLTASTSTTGVSYYFYVPAGYSGSIDSTSGKIAMVSQEGKYAVRITRNSNGCWAEDTIDVANNKNPFSISIAVSSGTITCNEPYDTLRVDDSGLNDKTFKWNASSGGTIKDGITSATAIVSSAGDYTVTVTDTITGCKATDLATVSADTIAPSIADVTKNPDSLTCIKDVNLVADVSNYTSLSWSGPGNITPPDQDSVYVDEPGYYSLTATASNGCTSTYNNIKVPADTASPNIVITTNYDDITCSNTHDTLNVSSSTPNVTYQWSKVSGSGTLTNSGTQNPVVDGAGTFRATITSDNGCTTDSTVSVDTNYTKPVIDNFDRDPKDISCKNQTVELWGSTSTPDSALLWTTTGIGDIDYETTERPVVDEPGDYTLTVTNLETGCTVDSTVTVERNDSLPVAKVEDNPGQITCIVDTVSIDGSASSGVNFKWTERNGNILSDDTLEQIYVGSDGWYILTVEHPTSGCTRKDSVYVDKANSVPGINEGSHSTTTLTCTEDTAILRINSVEVPDYWWSTSNGNIKTGDSTLTVVVDEPGKYTFTAVDSTNGCSNAISVKVDEETTPPKVSLSSETLTCNTDTVHLSSKVEYATDVDKVSYLWEPGAGGHIVPGDSSRPNPRVTKPATYTLTLTDDLNGCTAKEDITVSENTTKPAIYIDNNPDDITCANPKVTLEETSGQTDVSYVWSTTGNGNIANKYTPTPTVDSAGWYTLKITDNNTGCFVEDSVEVEPDYNQPGISINPDIKDITCSRDSVKLEGGSPDDVYYEWTGAGTITDPNSQLTYVYDGATTYTLTVTDKVNGCTNDSSVTVVENTDAPDAPVLSSSSTCNGSSNVALTATTGTNIKWYSDAGLTDLVGTGDSYTPTVTAPGDYAYHATQTGSNGCTSDPASVIYTIHSLPGEPTAADTSVCYGATNPFMDAYPSNSKFDIRWYNSADSMLSESYSYQPNYSAVGTYEFGVSQVDTNGCESSQTSAYFTINALPSAPVVDEDTLSVCYGSEKTFVANGDNVKWYNTVPPANAIATGNVFTPSESTTGTYSYYVTQSNSSTSCESNYTKVTYIILPNPDKFDLTGGGTYCEGTNGVSIELSGSENTATYELRRDGNTFITGETGTGSSLSFDNITSEGTFTAYATSADGCISKMNGTVSVTQDPLPEEPGTISGDSLVCQGATVDYSVPEIEYAADYIWSVPEGAEIIAGDNSRTITVSYSDTAESGIITVYGSNSCGDGPESVGHAIDVNPLPDSAKAITGPTQICQGENGVALEVPQIDNANDYVWTLPSGATITSGAGTQQIMVDFSNSFTGGIIKVHGENACGSGESSPDHTIDVTDKPIINTDLYKSVCSSSDSLIVENPGGGVTVLWELIGGKGKIGNANSFETEVTSLGTGINKFMVTLSNGSCAAKDTVAIENNQLFVNAGTDDQLCTDSTRLSGSVPDNVVTGTWTAEQGGANFADANVYNTDITEIDEGKNVFRWTLSKNGCESYDEVTIINNAPTEADAGISRNICGDSIDLNANATGSEETGTWNINNGFVNFENKQDPNTKITEVAKGENTLTWTIEKYDCSSSDQIKITNNKVEVEAGRDQPLCAYTTTLNAEAPNKGDGEWSIIEGQASFDNRESPNTEVYLGDADTTVLAWNVYYNGCQSIDSLKLINNSPSKADAGADQEVFQNSTFLDAAVPSKGDGEWSLLEGSGNFEDDTDPKTKVTDLAYGENRFQWIVTYESCISIDTVTIDNQTAGSINAGKDTIICSDQIQLNASRPQYGEGEWSVVRGSASFDDLNNPETVARGLSKDTNKLKWTVYGAGVVSDEVLIINNSPTSANTGPDMTYCADSTQLSANSPTVGEGVWSTIGGSGSFDDSTKNNTMVRNLSNGKNTFRWTITHENCESSDDVVITNDKPTVADAGQDQPLCSDEAVLYGNSPAIGEGLWTLVSGSNSVTFQDQTIGNTIVKNLGHGDNVLRWTITNGNCSSSDDVVITNDNPTEPNAGRNKSICVDSFRLNANEITIGESSWKVISGYGEFDDSTQHNTMVRNLAKGNNILRWTAENNGCILQDEVEISNDLVEANAGISQSICVDSTSLSANNPAPGTGYWSVVAGSAAFEDPNQSDTDVSGLDHQVTNILKWTIANEGCVSSDTITIDNNHPGVIYAGQDKEICGNEVTLKANPNYLGEGEWSSLTGGGVIQNQNSSSTTVTDLSLGNNTFRWTIRRNGYIYSDEVTIYNNSPVEAYAGENDSTCSNSYTLHAEEPPFGRGKWTVIAGSGEFENDTSYTTKVNNMAQGANTYKWTLYNGSCSTSDEVTIVVNKPDTPLAGPDKTVCSDSAFLQGNHYSDEQTGYWEIVEGSATFEDKNDPKTKVTGLNYGRNTLRWNIEKNGCLLYDEVTITNNSPTVAFAGDNMHVCGDETSLNAEKPSIGTGKWSLVSGTGTFEDKTSAQTVVSDLSYGPNTFRWTTKHNGCTSIDEVIVYNDQATAYAGEDQETYEPSAYLVGNTPRRGEGKWVILGGSGTFENADSAQTMVWDLSPGVNTFRWKITNNECIAFDEVSITYYEMPEVEFTVDTNNGCPPLEVQFLNKSLNSTSQFEWDFGDNNISTHENPRHTYYEPGEYEVVLSTVGPDGSLVTEDTTIIVHDIPQADFDVAPNELYIPEQHLQGYNMSIDADRFLWHFGDDSTSTQESPRHTYQDTGTYDIGLEVWSKYNCYDSIVKPNLVTVEQSGKIKFPSGFTPNPGGPVGGHYNENDRSNDVFHPIVKGVAEYHLEIFNRWGVMVFQSDNIDVGWDGYFKGELAAEGVYIYKVTGRYNNGRSFEKTGDFILIRK